MKWTERRLYEVREKRHEAYRLKWSTLDILTSLSKRLARRLGIGMVRVKG